MSHAFAASFNVIFFLSIPYELHQNYPVPTATVCQISLLLLLQLQFLLPAVDEYFLLSLSATKDNTCKTISLKKVPIRSFPLRVSSNGISRTTISTPFSFCQHTPLFQNFLIISSQSINTFYIQQIIFL